MERLVAYIVWGLALAAFIAVCYKANADTLEFIGPVGLTQHIINDPTASARFSGKVSKDGSLILTPQYGFIRSRTANGAFSSLGQYVGTNSVGSLMTGFISEFGRSFGRCELGLALGAYVQDDQHFKHLDIQPFEVTRIGNIGIVPIGGIAFNAKVYQVPGYYVKVNTLTSPVLMNVALSVGVSW